MNVDDAADELYALLPEEFVEARNAMAKRAKSEGAADAAARIKALRKPTLAAWLANRLAREHRSGVADLASLGEQMRTAMAAMDGPLLRDLTTRRKELVDGLLRQARQLARAAGQRPSEEMVETLNETLLAAVANPQAADALQAGRLAHGLQHVGFGPVEDDGEPARVISLTEARAARGQRLETGRKARSAATGPGEDDRYEPEPAEPAETADDTGERAAAEHELEEAESAVADADDRVDDLEAELDDQRQRLEAAQSSVERLTADLADARRELEQARDEVVSAEDGVDKARRDAELARRKRREAKQRLSRIDD